MADPVALGIKPPEDSTKNALAMMLQLSQTQGALANNRLLNQKFDANNAIGGALKGAMDSETGDIDQTKTMSSILGGPAGFMGPEIQQQLLAAKSTKLDTMRKQFELVRDQSNEMANWLTALVAKGGNVTQKDVSDLFGTAIGTFNDPKFTNAAAGLWRSKPPDTPAGNAMLPQWLQTLHLKTLDAQQKATVFYNLLDTKDPNTGAPGVSPRTDFAPFNNPGGGAASPPTATGNTTTPPPTAPNPLAPAGGATETPAASGPVTPPGTPRAGGGTPRFQATGPSADRAAYLAAAGPAAAADEASFNQQLASEGGFQQRLVEINKILPSIQTGGGTQLRTELASNARGILSALPGIAPETIQKVVSMIQGGDPGAAQEFRKLALQGAVENLNSLMRGNQRNQKEFDTFLNANVELNTDPNAVEKMLNFVTTLYNNDKLRSDELVKYKTTGKPMANFENHFQGVLAQKGLIKPNERSPGPSNAAPPPAAVVPAAPAPLGAARVYKRVNGQLVPQ